MIDGVTVLWWSLALIGLAGSALCSGLEVGFYSVPRVLVRVRSGTHRDAALLDAEIDRPVPVLTTLLAYNNIFNYLGTLAVTALLSRTGLGDAWIIVLQAAVLTPVILIFAESVPKEVFRSRAGTLMERLARVLVFMRLTLTVVPVVPMIRLVAGACSRALGADLSGSVRSARETMADLIKHGDERISAAQSELIDRALALEHARVDRVMVPLSKSARLSASASSAEALALVRRGAHTRIPVHDHTGRVHACVAAIDLLTRADTPIPELARPVSRIESGVSVREALLTLRDEGTPMGIITRSGRDIGLVTRRDLMAPLLGVVPNW